MSKFYYWEKVVLAVLATLSSIAGYQRGGLIDAIMAMAINTLILYGLLRFGKKVFIWAKERDVEIKSLLRDVYEENIVLVGLIIWLVICLFASWLGERMHDPEDYYRGNSSYLQEACPDCDKF